MSSRTNVLITGATGFIGSHLVNALSALRPEVKITVFVRPSSSLACLKEYEDISFSHGDLLDIGSLERSLEGIDIIYHLSGILGRHGVPEKRYYAVNTKGTENILKACVKNRRVRQFIHLSSAGVLGPDVIDADENCRFNPSNIYEKSKADAEKAVYDYYINEGVPAVVLRPGFLYGPKDTHVLELFRVIKKRLFFLIDNGKSLLHPTYIGDLVQVLLACFNNRDVTGKAYLVAGERPVTVKEFAEMVSRYLGISYINKTLPKRAMLSLAGVFEWAAVFLKSEPVLSESRVRFFTESRSYDTSKAESELAYHPIPLEEGIEKTITWYRLKGFL